MIRRTLNNTNLLVVGAMILALAACGKKDSLGVSGVPGGTPNKDFGKTKPPIPAADTKAAKTELEGLWIDECFNTADFLGDSGLYGAHQDLTFSGDKMYIVWEYFDNEKCTGEPVDYSSIETRTFKIPYAGNIDFTKADGTVVLDSYQLQFSNGYLQFGKKGKGASQDDGGRYNTIDKSNNWTKQP